MKKAAIISSLCFLLLIGILPACVANNITVSAISLTNRNTSTQTVRVNFNLNWDNSWRTTSAPFNWDAAWVFVKYRVGTTGEWKHATLATTGHTLPVAAASTQTDATGIFIYRSAAGTGTFNPTGIQLQWNYGSDGVANEARIFVRVFAIEMVYNPPGGFQAGSGAISNGEFRRANDVTSSGTASTFTITGSLPTVQGNSSSSSPTNIAAYNNTSIDLTGTNTASLAAGYPTGFNAFYSMKYEISQQQYVDFLNTLTYTQQAARTAASSPPNSAASTGALISGNLNRNGIDIQTPGTASTVPAVYACNLDDDGIYNEADDGQHIACNYLSWDDLTAYLDWAGLRPMTELEFEKSCRGNLSPVAGEYPWGSTSATALSGLTNPGFTNELASNAGSNIAFTNAFNTGPVRTGIFATATNSRSTSGAGYYGNMELGGNLWERVVTIGTSNGRTFSATHGNGTLTSGGAADVSVWPAATGSGWKGGAYDTAAVAANSSGRTQAANGNNSRVANAGGRGVRTVTTGIVTDGLILWLDAGITPSYPGTGTTWTDLSGNRNNGTLVNSPTFNSSNGGSIVFETGNPYLTLSGVTLNTNQGFTISMWIWINDPQPLSVWNYWFSTGNCCFEWGTFGVNTGAFQFKDNGAAGTPIIQSPYIGNQWANVSFGCNSTTPFLYTNGVSSGSAGNFRNTNITLSTIWSFLPNNSYLKGRQGIIIIYNRALNASEVLQNFNAQKARFGL
jgi:formylglycine-generating enzyme required for sulfatase activity